METTEKTAQLLSALCLLVQLELLNVKIKRRTPSHVFLFYNGRIVRLRLWSDCRLTICDDDTSATFLLEPAKLSEIARSIVRFVTDEPELDRQ